MAASWFHDEPLLASTVIRPNAVDTQMAAHSLTRTFVHILASGAVLLQAEAGSADTALCTQPGREESRVMWSSNGCRQLLIGPHRPLRRAAAGLGAAGVVCL